MMLPAFRSSLRQTADVLREATANLWQTRQRSALGLIGIAVGAAAVVATLNLGHNARVEAVRRFDGLGTDLAVVRALPDPDGTTRFLDNDRIKDIEALPAITTAVPLAVHGGQVAGSDRELSASIVGAAPGFLELSGARIARGRFIGPADAGAQHVVLSAGLAEKMGSDGRELRPGDRIRIGPYAHTVVGVLAPAIRNPLLSFDVDNSVLVPFQGLPRVGLAEGVTDLVLRMAGGEDGAELVPVIQARFAMPPRGATVAVETARQMIEAMRRQVDIYSSLLLAIGAVSLLVGGVGVMNVMLMNALERRREVGLRLALGAAPADIRNLFLAEAVVVSAAGGVVGSVIGLVVATGLAAGFGWEFVPAPMALPVGVLVAGGVGLVSGVYPALQAAVMDPVAVLRGT